MPAMPMADSSAPMVVGARQTSSATSAVTLDGFAMKYCFASKSEKAYSETVTNRKMMVSATSRICSAISFGVFLRDAPSTMAIILSRKLSPVSQVTLITSQSDTTVVPPVTALRSPPLSRMTGADSPVMALSSTLATPSMTSPSAGICSPAFTITMSPFFSSAEATFVILSFSLIEGILWASTSRLAARSASACALPRPSAMASAKLANRQVNHSMTAMARIKPALSPASFTPNSAQTNRRLVRMAET